ncbi:MAG: beta strand repeat-containing protein, partial [Verrucomicrobiota bacterium]
MDTSTAGQINLIVSGGPVVWNGGSATDSNWSDAANWNGNGPVPGAILNFSGTTRLNNTNDTTEGTSYGTLDFLSGAGGFSLNGNSLTLGGNVVNHSSALQTFNLGLLFSSNLTLDGGTGGLSINGGLTNTLGSPGATVVSLAGEGTLDNRITGANSPGGTNTIHVLTNANWTLLDNPSHTAVTLPLSLAVNGTFHFGSSNSAPVVTATPVGLAGISGLSYDTVGNVAGATGTLNIEGGNLMLPNNGRLYVANGANARGILNVSGGALNLRGGLQAANGNAVNQVAVVNVSGGLLNMGTTNTGTQQSIYLAATGTGTLNLSGAGVVSCVTLDVSGNQHGNTIGSVGTVNLNGGTLIPTTVTTASASPQSGLANGTSATFNFNGGTLRARGTAATVFRGNLSNPTLPITSIVKTGGAVLDSANYSLLMYEPLQHDASLASALDGGLKKLGTGRVELHQPSTYTGPTVILAGTLALTEAGTVMDSALIFVTNNAVLDVSGLNAGFTLTGGQVLAGRGRVGGDVVVADGATLVPGVANAQLSFTNGTLMFSNSLTLQDGSVTIMGLNGGLNPSNTTAQVNAALTYGGSLVISNFSNTAFQVGDTFKLFAASAYSGAFTNIVYPSGYTWTNSLDTDGSVTVLTVAPPLPTTPTNVSFSISSGLLHLAWPTEYRGWILQ